MESWQQWSAGRALNSYIEDWNSVDPHNGAALIDHRRKDGWIYLIYGGKDAQCKDDFCGTASTKKMATRLE